MSYRTKLATVGNGRRGMGGKDRSEIVVVNREDVFVV